MPGFFDEIGVGMVVSLGAAAVDASGVQDFIDAYTPGWTVERGLPDALVFAVWAKLDAGAVVTNEALIAAGRFPQGSMLPNERELVAEFGVSIDTVRRATAELRKRGRVVTYPSRGTYVTSLLETRAYPGTPRGTRVNPGARR